MPEFYKTMAGALPGPVDRTVIENYTFYVFASLLHEGYGDRVVDDFGKALSEIIGKSRFRRLHTDFERIARSIEGLNRVGVRMIDADSHGEKRAVRIIALAKIYLADAGFNGDEPDRVRRCVESLATPLNQIEAFVIELRTM